MTDLALSVQALVKTYGSHRAVDGVSFQVRKGGVFGVLGPNGAGKSTTLRMVLGILRPDAGEVRLLGAAPTRETLRRVGFLPEERGLYKSMTPLGILVFMGRLKGMKAAEARQRGMRLLEEHGLGGYADKRVKTLSKGMAQKVQILAAIIHEPDVVILDEPFSGLDPINQHTVERLISGYAHSGRTVLFSTHVMEHAERMCDSIVLIAQGKTAFFGAVQDALHSTPRQALLETEGAFDLRAALAGQGFAIEEETGETQPGLRRWRAPLEGADASRRLLAACVAAGAPLTLFEPTKASLHEAFVRLVGSAAAPADPRAGRGWRNPNERGA
jgi:ABC-2 type transport system ATP-binding protein